MAILSSSLRAIACVALAAMPLAAQAPTGITLADAIARGRSGGVQAALAQLSAKTVDARRAQRAGDYLPNVTGTAQAVRQTLNLTEFGLSLPGVPPVTDPFTVYRVRATAEQLLFNASTLERMRAARDTAIAAGLDAQRIGDLSAAAAGAAWLRLASAEETVKAREADSVTVAALLEIARSQVDAGTAPRIDRTRSETQVAALRSNLLRARNERDRARIDLARAIGAPPTQALATSGDPAVALGALPTNADSAVALALAKRQDLAAETQRATVLERNLTVIKNEFIPSVGLRLSGGTSGVALDELHGTWDIGIGLSWALFDGFRRERRMDEQRIRIDAQKLRARDLAAQVEAEVRQAALDLESANGEILVAQERLRLAEQELQEARERFAAGVAGSVETTNAQAEVTTARDVLIQARVAAGAAQVNAAKAIGLLDQVH